MEQASSANRYSYAGTVTPLHKDSTVRELVVCLRRLAGQFRALLDSYGANDPAPWTAVDGDTAISVFRQLDRCRLMLAERLAARSSPRRCDQDALRLTQLVATARASELAMAHAELEALFLETRRLEGRTAAILRRSRRRTGSGRCGPALGPGARGAVQGPDLAADKKE